MLLPPSTGRESRWHANQEQDGKYERILARINCAEQQSKIERLQAQLKQAADSRRLEPTFEISSSSCQRNPERCAPQFDEVSRTSSQKSLSRENRPGELSKTFSFTIPLCTYPSVRFADDFCSDHSDDSLSRKRVKQVDGAQDSSSHAPASKGPAASMLRSAGTDQDPAVDQPRSSLDRTVSVQTATPASPPASQTIPQLPQPAVYAPPVYPLPSLTPPYFGQMYPNPYAIGMFPAQVPPVYSPPGFMPPLPWYQPPPSYYNTPSPYQAFSPSTAAIRQQEQEVAKLEQQLAAQRVTEQQKSEETEFLELQERIRELQVKQYEPACLSLKLAQLCYDGVPFASRRIKSQLLLRARRRMCTLALLAQRIPPKTVPQVWLTKTVL